MIRKNVLILGLLVMSLFVGAQTVDNIRTVQDGEKINIYYKIESSNSEQLFNITVSCKMGSRDKFVLKSVTGDVGDNVQGGKKEYKVVWDVLKDVDELTDVEFFVKAVLIKDNKPAEVEKPVKKKEEKPVVVKEEKPKVTDNTIKERNWFLTYNAGLAYTQVGLRAGYMKNWGWYAAFRFGNTYSVTGGVTKRIVNKEKFKLHSYLGGGLGEWHYNEVYTSAGYWDEYGNWVDTSYWNRNYSSGFEIELGLIGNYKRFVFSLGGATMHGDAYDLVVGLGMNF